MTSGDFFSTVNSISQMLVLWFADTIIRSSVRRTRDLNSLCKSVFSHLSYSHVPLAETCRREISWLGSKWQ